MFLSMIMFMFMFKFLYFIIFDKIDDVLLISIMSMIC